MCVKLCCAVSLDYFAYLAAAAVDWLELTCVALYRTLLYCAVLCCSSAFWGICSSSEVQFSTVWSGLVLLSK